jgi:hypothetical protein
MLQINNRFKTFIGIVLIYIITILGCSSPTDPSGNGGRDLLALLINNDNEAWIFTEPFALEEDDVILGIILKSNGYGDALHQTLFGIERVIDESPFTLTNNILSVKTPNGIELSGRMTLSQDNNTFFLELDFEGNSIVLVSERKAIDLTDVVVGFKDRRGDLRIFITSWDSGDGSVWVSPNDDRRTLHNVIMQVDGVYISLSPSGNHFQGRFDFTQEISYQISITALLDSDLINASAVISIPQSANLSIMKSASPRWRDYPISVSWVLDDDNIDSQYQSASISINLPQNSTYQDGFIVPQRRQFTIPAKTIPENANWAQFGIIQYNYLFSDNVSFISRSYSREVILDW